MSLSLDSQSSHVTGTSAVPVSPPAVNPSVDSSVNSSVISSVNLTASMTKEPSTLPPLETPPPPSPSTYASDSLAQSLKQSVKKKQRDLTILQTFPPSTSSSTILPHISSLSSITPLKSLPSTFTYRRSLNLHQLSVYCVSWCDKYPTKLVSCGKDGQLLLWDAAIGLVEHLVKMKSSFIMTCAYAPDASSVACAGLGGEVQVFSLSDQVAPVISVPSRTYYSHSAWIPSIRYLSSRHVVTCSGDQTIAIVDVNSSNSQEVFQRFSCQSLSDNAVDSGSDLLCLSAQRQSETPILLSGASNANIYLFDGRAGRSSVQCFSGHASDVNSVVWLPSGHGFLSSSDDKIVKIFDVRRGGGSGGGKEGESVVASVSLGGWGLSVDVSCSGRVAFIGVDTGEVTVVDVLSGAVLPPLQGHTQRVSSVQVSADGYAVATGAWDNTIRIYS